MRVSRVGSRMQVSWFWFSAMIRPSMMVIRVVGPMLAKPVKQILSGAMSFEPKMGGFNR